MCAGAAVFVCVHVCAFGAACVCVCLEVSSAFLRVCGGDGGDVYVCILCMCVHRHTYMCTCIHTPAPGL